MKKDWRIQLKSATGKWFDAMTVFDVTEATANRRAADALRYYEGTTEWRIFPT